MVMLSVVFSGYHQGFPELSACSLSMRPDFITLVETHLAGELLQMHLPTGYVVVARHDRSRHGSGVLLLSRDNLLVDSVDCKTYYVCGTSEIIGVHYQGTLILCVYRQPGVSDTTLVDSLAGFRVANSHRPLLLLVLARIYLWSAVEY